MSGRLTPMWPIWLAASLALGIADWATTAAGLSAPYGAGEANPVAAALQGTIGMHGTGALALAACAVMGMLAGVAGSRPGQVVARWGGRALIAGHLAVVVSNAAVIAAGPQLPT